MSHAGDFPVWDPKERHVPVYYKFEIMALDGTVVTIDIYELLLQMDDVGLAFAAKHLLRAGRKPGASAILDVSKCMEELERWLEIQARHAEAEEYDVPLDPRGTPGKYETPRTPGELWKRAK